MILMHNDTYQHNLPGAHQSSELARCERGEEDAAKESPHQDGQDQAQDWGGDGDQDDALYGDFVVDGSGWFYWCQRYFWNMVPPNVWGLLRMIFETWKGNMEKHWESECAERLWKTLWMPMIVNRKIEINLNKYETIPMVSGQKLKCHKHPN